MSGGDGEGAMRKVVALIFISSVALGQTLPDQPSAPTSVISGSPQGWPASAISLSYPVPDPIGTVDLNFTVNNLNLVEGSISFGDGEAISLPGQLLECLPLPRPREAHLSTLYIDSSDRGAQLPDELTSYITIPYGRPVSISSGGVSFTEYASVEFGLTDRNLRHVGFIKPNGERYVLNPITNSCSAELTRWLAE
jgi:hypothetical protein